MPPKVSKRDSYSRPSIFWSPFYRVKKLTVHTWLPILYTYSTSLSNAWLANVPLFSHRNMYVLLIFALVSFFLITLQWLDDHGDDDDDDVHVGKEWSVCLGVDYILCRWKKSLSTMQSDFLLFFQNTTITTILPPHDIFFMTTWKQKMKELHQVLFFLLSPLKKTIQVIEKCEKEKSKEKNIHKNISALSIWKRASYTCIYFFQRKGLSGKRWRWRQESTFLTIFLYMCVSINVYGYAMTLAQYAIPCHSKVFKFFLLHPV